MEDDLLFEISIINTVINSKSRNFCFHVGSQRIKKKKKEQVARMEETRYSIVSKKQHMLKAESKSHYPLIFIFCIIC